jgi:hypothetical protein
MLSLESVTFISNVFIFDVASYSTKYKKKFAQVGKNCSYQTLILRTSECTGLPYAY